MNQPSAISELTDVALPSTEGPIPSRLYTRTFFQVFAAGGLFMTAVSLQFHFGQYVAYLGHSVDTLGRILSISMIGTLLIRLRIGRWIDRFGCRPVWLMGTATATVVLLIVQFAQQLWIITLLRLVGTMAIASVMTTVAVFAAQIAPPERRAESIGSIGLAGFLGMTIGPALGDWIFNGPNDSITPYRIFFTAGAVCSALAGLIIVFVDLPHERNRSATNGRRTSQTLREQLAVIRRHWPGIILLVGVIFHMSFCIQSMYLERLAEARGFLDIKLFFFCYCPTAMTLRLVFRRVPQQLGRTRTLLMGLCFLAAGQLSLIGIQAQWGLIIPGIMMGAGHCFVFPSMVDLAAESLPSEDRGTGTAAILGAGDVGMLIGFGALGELIDNVGFDATFKILAGIVAIAALLLAATRWEHVFRRDLVAR